ncbi:nitrophenyl compound nitroreductase subunit ArsF family protein [Bacteroides ihuae]|uniref:nitrophenyl compound nitroreductase subunit ArsF family protein n=1 Tax=Bacteroides ihuae TaxID=1852362 RepID=UPI0008DB111B|nr:nitrophenyl compound nitroreductase subunit ArsF family protein [Bacteroides ihuae]
MKQLLFAIIAVMISATAFGKDPKTSEKANNGSKDRVEILYFHGKQRCPTCMSIEKNTQEVMKAYYSDKIKKGEVVFTVIDISNKANEKIADRYEVTWSSLFVNKWKGGKESKNNMTEFAFAYSRNSPDTFKNGLKKKINELLK